LKSYPLYSLIDDAIKQNTI